MPQRARTRDEIVADICEQIAGGAVLTDVLGPDRPAGYPSRKTFYGWKEDNAEYETQYENAVKVRIEKFLEETVEIADNGTNDWMLKNDPQNAGYIANGEHVQRSKIRISTRQWLAEKMWPRKYGQKVALGGADDLPPMQSNVTVAPAGTPEEVYRAMLTGGVLAKPVEPESEDLGGYV